ncbi:RNA polymerase sigma-70 factor [Mucilaginibacter sp. FT3.2]|uniref:RNA polymerase sigma-70 factor n=1 Tax=Mucilaginibacter sp. FT3.2 TaxID=2723090 RepID=UPI00160E454F|nr:RNA polymerase sigma-70 factor [Mucilaginibacter sp. FT3.2]MBB6231504.1 RNA polymerase sigma-70 factor (ECF subfamily) [Mucilaginibacter sp. FT3.2]
MALSFLSDADLWELILNDNYRAFTTLFQRHWLRLYRTALKYIKDEEACEEVVHDLFLNLWKRKAHLKIENFDHYLKAATRYQVYTYLKAHKPSPVLYLEDYELDNKVVEFNNGYEKMMYNDLEGELNQQIQVLPNRCQEIFILSRIHKLSNMEIAEKLGVSKRTVENQLTHALRFIRGRMKHIAFIIAIFLHF